MLQSQGKGKQLMNISMILIPKSTQSKWLVENIFHQSEELLEHTMKERKLTLADETNEDKQNEENKFKPMRLQLRFDEIRCKSLSEELRQ